MEDRSHKTVQMLKELPENHGFAVRGDVVVIVGPGDPPSERPTLFTKADLGRAVGSGLLVERKLSGSVELVIYAAR